MKKLLFTGLFLVIGLGSYAQSFLLDSTFQPFFDITKQRGGVINAIYEETDGRIYVLGNFRISNGQNPNDGSTCMNRNGSMLFNYVSGAGNGSYTTIIKVNDSTFFMGNGASNGSLKNHLGFNIGFTWRANYLNTVRCRTGSPYFYPDGSSLFGNGRDNSGLPCPTIYNGDTLTRRHILKLNPEGLWDSTFTGDANHQPSGFAPYDSNRILIYGSPGRFTHYNGVRVNGLCRIFLDGTLDTTFSSPLQPLAFGSVPLPNLVNKDGSFFLLGAFYVNGHPDVITIARLKANGELDSTFMNFSSPRNLVFGTGSVITLAELPDNGYLIGGSFNRYQGYQLPSIAKIDSIGKVDPTYFINSGPDSSARYGAGFPIINVIYQSKFGGYYVGGDFRKWNGKSVQPIVRITDLVTNIREFGKLAEKVSLVVYPNPTKESITLKLESFMVDATYEVQLREISGKLLLQQRITRQEQAISLSNLAKGSYLLVLYKDGLQVAEQLIVKN